jgi:hypothetical protein
MHQVVRIDAISGCHFPQWSRTLYCGKGLGAICDEFSNVRIRFKGDYPAFFADPFCHYLSVIADVRPNIERRHAPGSSLVKGLG